MYIFSNVDSALKFVLLLEGLAELSFEFLLLFKCLESLEGARGFLRNELVMYCEMESVINTYCNGRH